MNFMRMAWFSPFPPVRTGIAACSAELVTALRARGHEIDAYPDTAAHDFPWIHRQRPYDLVVYQFGNSSHHDYAWPYALRYPGLLVLHDTHLHHARAALLLREKRRDDYRRELAWSEPAVHPDAAELAIAGMDSRLFYEWPMVRSLVSASRLVAVHGEATRRELLEALSDIPWNYSEKIVSIRLGHGQLVSAEEEEEARAKVRTRYGIAQDAMVFGVFGGLTPEKRLPQILAAFEALRPYAPDAHLLLGGAEAAHFPLDAFRGAARVTVTGYIDDRELTDHLAAVDVSLNLRWPTARETSGPWLRALAAGKPSVVIDLLQLGDVPTLDPRTWQTNAAPREAIAIAIDILDEDHSLRLAMRRLATDADLRARLGRAAQAYWKREHTVDAMADDYERVIGVRGVRGVREVLGVLEVREERPEHLRPDGDERLRTLLEPFGIENPL